MDSFNLENNYPNPFNPTTTIGYSLPGDGYVRIAISDILGQEIRSLVSEFKSAGHHHIMWNGLDNDGLQVTSGVYFYTLTTEKYSDTSKLLLIR